jgi:hypothetical protein
MDLQDLSLISNEFLTLVLVTGSLQTFIDGLEYCITGNGAAADGIDAFYGTGSQDCFLQLRSCHLA